MRSRGSGPIVNDEGVGMRIRLLFCATTMLASCGVLAIGLAGTTGIASASPARTRYTCTGGEIPSGTYDNITVTGACAPAADAVITIVGNLNVAADAQFDAQSAPSTIIVGHNVTAAVGSFLGLGCQPSNTIGIMAGVPCIVEPEGHTTITVGGNVTATDADTVLLRKLTINGLVRLDGGGGDIPWSIKGNTVGGSIMIRDVTADWLGVQFNGVGGDVTLTNITATDPGDPGRTVAVVENTVGKNLNCNGLEPGVSGGFIPGEVNHVAGRATGQCASLV
jgi:hypothetical protein